MVRLLSTLSVWPVRLRVWHRGFLAVLLGALFALMVHKGAPNHFSVQVSLRADIPEGAGAVAYFSSDGKLFFPQNHVDLVRRLEAGRTTWVGRLESRKPILAVRIDPTNRQGPVAWHSLRLSGSGGKVEYSGDALLSLSPVMEQLVLQEAGPRRLSLMATGPDAQVIIRTPMELTAQPDRERVALRRLLFLLATVSAALLSVGDLLMAWWIPRLRVVGRLVDQIAGSLSDERVVVFSRSSIAVYFLLLVAFGGWVALGLHQSSIGVWDGLYSTAPVERSIHVGQPRPIRSDEWNVLTPWVLSQVQTGMSLDNPNVGAEGSTLLAGTPVAGPLMLAQPKYWGFLLLDTEHGFSWYWAFKTFGVIAAVFTLLLAMTRGDVVISLAGAVFIFGSSMVQWWFSGFAPEMIIGLCVGVIGSMYLFWGRKTGGMLWGALLLALLVPYLLMHLYPPHLVPVGYLGLFLVAGLAASPQALRRVLEQWPRRLALGLVAAGVGGWLVWIWYTAVGDAVRQMMHTEYPGARFYLGGDMPWRFHFHGIFESWKVDAVAVPFPPTNPTKASRFWVLFPLLVLVVPARSLMKPDHRPMLALLGYCFFVLCWSSVPLPEVVRQALAHLGWAASAPWESAFGMGIASILLTSVIAAQLANRRLQALAFPGWGATVLAFAMVFAYGRWLSAVDPVFFDMQRVLGGAVAAGVLVFALHRGIRWLYLALALMAALPAVQVNPVQNGFNVYANKDVFSNARQLAGGKGVWAVYGDLRIAQGFKAAGLQVVNGTHYLPRRQVLSQLDPQGNAQDIWNRYAHVEYVSAPAGTNPSFDLVFPDHYQIALDVCGPHIRAIGVTHVAYTYAPSAAELACLTPLAPPVSDGAVRYYRLQ